MMPIKNASSIPLSQQVGTLPYVRDVLNNWFQPTTFITIVKSVVNFELKEVETEVTFMGVVQPLSPQELAMKPEGQRNWIWQMVHATPDLNLTPDEIIKYQEKRYRVMARLDYTSYGYNEYHLVQDYTT